MNVYIGSPPELRCCAMLTRAVPAAGEALSAQAAPDRATTKSRAEDSS